MSVGEHGMGSWIEVFRLVGTLIAMGLVISVVAVSLIFEAPRTWPRGRLTGGSGKGRRRAPI